jgi:hypothetical protein
MTTVQEAKALLEKAELEEKLQYRQKELFELITQHKNKCFGSHTFERKTQAGMMEAIYYEDFYLKDNEIWVREWKIFASKHDSFYKKGKYVTQFNRNMCERQLTGQNEYNPSYNLYSGYSHYRHEIPLVKFIQLWEKANEVVIEIEKSFYKTVPELKQELIRQGDSMDESTIEECIKDTGIELIDLKDYPEVHRNLEYVTLPLFDNNRWLPKIYAKSIIEWYINTLKKELTSQFATERTIIWNNKRIKILTNFINTVL